jgi:hypothetical protein
MTIIGSLRHHTQEMAGHAIELDRPDVLSRRRATFDGQLDLEPSSRVFIDETRAQPA